MVIGINAYKNPKYTLNYAKADATSFKEQMEKPSDIFSDIKVHFISDADATKATIENAFKEIISMKHIIFTLCFFSTSVVAQRIETCRAELRNDTLIIENQFIARKFWQ